MSDKEKGLPVLRQTPVDFLRPEEARQALNPDVALDATESCDDRVSLRYNTLREVERVRRVVSGELDQNLPELLSVARGVFRAHALEKIATAAMKPTANPPMIVAIGDLIKPMKFDGAEAA